MGRGRLPMRQTKEILRQKLLLHRSHREVAASLRVSIGTITSTLARTKQVGLQGWVDVERLSEQALEERLYPAGERTIQERRAPDWAYIHTERKLLSVLRDLPALAKTPTPEHAAGPPGG
jgi:hypothetical protein